MIEKAYHKIHTDLFKGIDTKGIHDKYVNPTQKRISNFADRLRLIAHQKGMRKGIDFGCGACTAVIIGKLFGLQITGLDILPPAHIKRKQPYAKLQKKLKKLGYKIVLRNTQEFPWTEFEDDQFDFMIAMYSLGEDASGLEREEGWRAKRLEELARITRPGAIWQVSPKGRRADLLKDETFVEIAKEKEYRFQYKRDLWTITEMLK